MVNPIRVNLEPRPFYIRPALDNITRKKEGKKKKRGRRRREKKPKTNTQTLGFPFMASFPRWRSSCSISTNRPSSLSFGYSIIHFLGGRWEQLYVTAAEHHPVPGHGQLGVLCATKVHKGFTSRPPIWVQHNEDALL